MDGSLGFELTETTIDRIHQAFAAGTLTARGLVNAYLKRIAAYDQLGPALNAIISLNPEALAEAERLDAIFKTSGPVGPLHGIPIVVKDQADVKGLPTTMGSVLFKGFMPDRDAFAVAKLRAAGAIILGKSTLGELGGGDTHGSLFGSTRNPFDIERTAGGSSGGSATCVSANFCTVAVAQEGFASIRRPSSWNGIVGMRPTQGLVSRGNVYAGWPSVSGSLGPMARTVSDAAKLLECMIGYDPADPVTARGYGRVTGSLSAGLKRDSLKGARIGILRESIGYASEPDSEDFKAVDVAFQRSIGELAAAGAMIVDPVVIPELKALLAKRAGDRATEEESFRNYFGPCRNAPFKTRDEAAASPLFAQVTRGSQDRWTRASAPGAYGEYLKAREDLMTRSEEHTSELQSH